MRVKYNKDLEDCVAEHKPMRHLERQTKPASHAVVDLKTKLKTGNVLFLFFFLPYMFTVILINILKLNIHPFMFLLIGQALAAITPYGVLQGSDKFSLFLRIWKTEEEKKKKRRKKNRKDNK